MKRLYLIQQDNDYIEFDYYFNFKEEAEYQKFAIEGGRGYQSFKFKEYEAIESEFDYFLQQMDDIKHKTCYAHYNTITDLLNNIFPKSNGKKYTSKEIHAYKELYNRIEFENNYDYQHYICDILYFMTGTKYTTTSIHGCSQGDYAEVIHPYLSKEKIDYIEACYFGTGTEYRCYIIDSEKVLTVDELKELDDDFWDYTAEWSEERYKAIIAKQMQIPIENVVLYRIASTYTTKHYKYEIA